MSPQTFLRLIRKYERRLAVAIIVVFIIVPLASRPNRVLYHCVPNPFAGLPSYKQVWDRGEYAQSFCKDGLYPVLRGSRATTAADVSLREQFTLFFVAVPVLLVLPVVFILSQKKGN
ncbi:MAG TPA: hypothetical protein VGM08_02280 [Candidatus Saccharimonadales bacterium]|jgi:hypothetical protein